LPEKVGLTCRSAFFFLQAIELETAASSPLIHESNNPTIHFHPCPSVIGRANYLSATEPTLAGPFGLRHSDFFRISDFGLRILSVSSEVWIENDTCPGKVTNPVLMAK
jgi:hypothetical protein